MSFIQEFWFYGFHSQRYPEFVENLTKEIDVFNELRIKPEILNIEVNIDRLTEENARLGQSQMLHARAPD